MKITHLCTPFRVLQKGTSAGSEMGTKGSWKSKFTGNILHWAICAINWSTRTKATIASTMGTAAGPVQIKISENFFSTDENASQKMKQKKKKKRKCKPKRAENLKFYHDRKSCRDT